MKNRLSVMLLFLFSGAAMAAEPSFRVGVGQAVITPQPLLPVSGGMGPTQPATRKLGDLKARAVVFAKGQERMAIVSLDLLGFPAVLGDRVRAAVPHLPADRILISATHTHSAPDVYAFPDGQGGHTGDLQYIDFVCRQAAAALQAAAEALQPAKLKLATDIAQGKIAYNYYAPDLYDRRMSVIQALDGRDEALFTLVNYAIHPEVLGAGVGAVSPDLVGPLCDFVESHAGGMAMFVNGAQGGMITADNRDLDKPSDPLRGYWQDIRSWDECQRIGQTMGQEALQMLASASVDLDPQLTCYSHDVRFPVESDALWQVILHSPLEYPHNSDRSINTRMNLICLGDAQLLTISGEALPNIGFYLKRKMRGKHNLLLGLTNDAFGYIMTKVDFNSFPRYEYISRTSLGESTGEILLQNAEEMIRQAASNE